LGADLVPNDFGGLVRRNGRRVGAPHRAQNAGPNEGRHGHHGNPQVHGGKGEVENGGRHPHFPERDLWQNNEPFTASAATTTKNDNNKQYSMRNLKGLS